MATRRALTVVSGDVLELPAGDILAGAFPQLAATAVKTSAYTASSGELVMCDGTSAGFTVTLPAAVPGAIVGVKRAVSVNTITIARAGSDTIGAAASTSINVRVADETTILQCYTAGVWLPMWNWLGLGSLDSRYVRPDVAATYSAKQTYSIATVNTPVALTDAATVAIDASLGNHFRLLTTSGVGATRALGAPTNPSDGQRILIEVIQDATGSRALTYNAVWRFGTDVVSPTLSTAASKTDYIGAIYNLAAVKWDVMAVAKGY